MDYVYVSDLGYGDSFYYDGSTWVVDEHNYGEGTVTIRDVGGHTYQDIDEYTLVEKD